MRIFNKIGNKLKKLNKKSISIAVIAIIAVITTSAIAFAEYYPVRRTFDYNKKPINGSTCTEADRGQYNRCGSMDGPVFNSFINTPSYGDERAFFDGRRSDRATNTNADQITDVTEGSKEVVLRTYVHNNANQDTNYSSLGVAKNAKVKIILPTGTGKDLRARSYISADNAIMVEDTTDLHGKTSFNLSYVQGSAKLLRGTAVKSLSDSIITDGALIGDNEMNGSFPGCFQYAALVEIKVKVNVEVTPKIDVAKQVRKYKEGQTGGWSESVATKPGDKVEFLINTKNVGDTNLTNVVTRDILPPHVQLVSGSVRYIDSNGSKVEEDQPLFEGGFNNGTYKPTNNTVYMFTVTVLGDFDPCTTRVRNIAKVKSTETPKEVEDTADVVIEREDCIPPKPEKPIYDCEAVSLQELGGRKIRVSVTPIITGNVSVKHYIYDFGDGSAPLITDKDTADHEYKKDGTFVADVNIVFNIDGKVKEIDSDSCTAPITFTAGAPEVPEQPEAEAPSKPGKPVELPATGPAEIVGVFIATTVAGTVAYNVVYRRFYV